MVPSFRTFIPVPGIHGTNGGKPQHMASSSSESRCLREWGQRYPYWSMPLKALSAVWGNQCLQHSKADKVLLGRDRAAVGFLYWPGESESLD